MPEHRKQILAAFLLLLILALAFHLRVAGLGWGLPGGYYHPDERGIIMHAGGIRFKDVPRQEEEGWLKYIQRATKENLQKDSPLNIKAFHYGTFPYYLMSGTRGIFNNWRKPDSPERSRFLKALPAWFALAVVLLILFLAWRYKINHPDAPLPRSFWWFLLSSVVVFLLAVWMSYQTFFIQNVFQKRLTFWRYLLFSFSMLTAIPAGLILLVDTWFRDKMTKSASMARLRLLGLLAFQVTVVFLFGYGLPTLLSRSWEYDDFGWIGRVYSVLAGVGTIALLYVLGARCYSRAVGFLAALFLALTVLHIQLCHYSAFDVLLVFFIVLALNFFERVQARGTLWAYAFSGMAVGAAVATKFSALPLALLFILPHLLYLFSLRREKNSATMSVPGRFLLAWLGLALAIVLGLATNFALQPFAFIDKETFWRSIEEQNRMVSGDALLPYTIQYLKTTPFFYPIKQLLWHGFGIPLGVLAFGSWLYVILKQFRRGDRTTLLLLGWTIPSFLLYGQFQVKYPRYFITIIPLLCLFAAIFVVDLLRRGKAYPSGIPDMQSFLSGKRLRRLTTVGLILVILSTALYAFSFVDIYRRPHTWEVASDWIYENVPSGAKILAEHWDDDLPKGRPGKNRHTMAYRIESLKVYEQDNESKIREMSRHLSTADYIVLATKRGYGSILRVPEKYPLTSNYYRALFAGQLGYQPVRAFTGSPKVLGLQLSAELLDESISVYDHPKVVVFRNVEKLKPEQLESIIVSPPSWVQDITYEEILTIQDGEPVFAPHPRFPILRWYLLLQAILLVFFPLCFPLFRNLKDGGWSLARPMGILLLAFTAWILSNAKILPFSAQGLLFIFLLYAIPALFLYRRYWKEMKTLIRERPALLWVEEAVWIGFLALFIVIRMYNPDIHWGEKPMDISFVTSAYRTEWFPPLDPWFSGHIINYYYYGHVVFSALGMLCGVPPHYLYNLAIGTIPALTALAAFGILFSLTRKYSYGILGAYLTTLAGNLFGYFQMAQNLGDNIPKTGLAGLTAALSMLFQVITLAFKVLRAPFSERIAEELVQSGAHRQMGFDSYFWKCGHDLIPHTVANEFPVWTHLFADLHAHMIVMPFTLLMIGLGYALFSGKGRGLRFNSDSGSAGWGWFLICITLGTIFCINPWDFPTSVLLLFAVLLLKWWRFRPEDHTGYLLRYLRCVRGFGLRSPSLSRFGFHVLRFSAEVFLPLLAIVLGSIALFQPFHMHFNPRVPLGWGSVLLSLGNMTRPETYLKIFGMFLFIVGSSLILRWHRIPGEGRMRRWFVLVLFTAIVLSASTLIKAHSESLVEYLKSAQWLSTFVLIRPHFQNMVLDYTTAAMLAPLWLLSMIFLLRRQRERSDAYSLLLAWIGLSVAIGTEFVFIREGWEHPAHRYNTVFKFFLQVWMYLALASAAALFWMRHHSVLVQVGGHSILRRVGKTLWALVLIFLFIASAMFPIFGTYAVISGPGARCVSGPRPDIDGLKYMNVTGGQAEFQTIHWLNRFVKGQPTLLEELGMPYVHDSSRLSTHSGIPTVIGWDHHMRERGPSDPGDRARHDREINDRKDMVQQIYRSQDKTRVINLLMQKGVEYVYVGTKERSKYSYDIRKFQGYGDVFDLIFRTRGGDLYQVRSNLNQVYLGEVTPLPPPGERPQETGVNMYIGGEGFDNGNFREPRGIAFDSTGNAYVADTFNHRIQVFDARGEFQFTFGREGQAEGDFKEPNDLLVAPNNKLYVLDTWNHRVQVFDLKGGFQYMFQASLFGPRGIACDREGHLYVTDTGNGMVKVFSPQGDLIRQWGRRGSGENELLEPVGIDVNDRGEVFVSDNGNQRIVVFDAGGRRIRSWSVAEQASPTPGNERHLRISPGGLILLSDPMGGQILIYEQSGQFVGIIAREGTIRAPVNFPVGLAFNPQSHDLAYCEQRLNRMARIPASILP